MAQFELTEEVCEALAQAGKAKSRAIGVGVTLAIADDSGNILYLQRFGDAILPSIVISQKKAYTSAVLRQSTSEFGKVAQVGASAFGINTADDRLIIFGGGFPLVVDGKAIGGLGVSGGSVEEDESVCEVALAKFAELATAELAK
jgi:uncharacterized protein GlcG (DUF336 family)